MDLSHVSKLNLERKDFQSVLLLFLIDISLTIYGITYAGGSEMSPLFTPFTSSISGMIAGSAVYISLLMVLNTVLTGRPRRILASVGISMHFAGILSWVVLLAEVSFTSSLIYINYIIIAITTAVAFSELERQGWTY
jgi:hypothetical protein